MCQIKLGEFGALKWAVIALERKMLKLWKFIICEAFTIIKNSNKGGSYTKNLSKIATN